MSKYWIKGATYLKGDYLSLEEGDILIDGDHIEAFTSPSLDQQAEYELIDAKHHLVMPGLINTHTHVAMSLLRGYGGGTSLHEWLNDYIWPAEAKMDKECIRAGVGLGLLEMIASGTTCFADMYDHMDVVARVVSESGMRANLCRGMIGMNDPEDRSIAENDDLFSKWHKNAEDRIRIWYGPHAPNTCPAAYLERVLERATDKNTGIHIHLAETKDEYRYIKERFGKSPCAFLNDLGIFERPTLAAHTVWIDESDREILLENKVSVAHNPVSNMKLASGISPVLAMRHDGINVALGTDGASSNNNLSMWKELQTAALIHKLEAFNPNAIRERDILKMATINGAKALHWETEIGSLDIGKKADMIFVNIDKPWYAPWHDHLENLVYSAHADDVEMTMVNGKFLYKNKEFLTLDAERIILEATRYAKQIVQ